MIIEPSISLSLANNKYVKKDVVPRRLKQFPFHSSAVKPTNAGYYIFGETQAAQSDEYIYLGTTLKYTASSDSESLYISGPTTIPLSIQINLFYNPESSELYRPRINFEYYIRDSTSPPSNPNYWVTSDGPCSVTCGNGKCPRVFKVKNNCKSSLYLSLSHQIYF